MKAFWITAGLILLFGVKNYAQENTNTNKFRQLKQELATPNVYHTASGAPGHQYWQQKADYKIAITLDDATQIIKGKETITYHNQSPDPLNYLWIQLDQNVRSKSSESYKIGSSQMRNRMSMQTINRLFPEFEGGFNIEKVCTKKGEAIPYTINNTMMRVDLKEVLQPGQTISFTIQWWYNINNRMEIGGRSGYEYFETDSNYLYTIAQFYPRMAVYNEVEGWQNKQFLGSGEFTLPFGDFEVHITAPADHIVGATGELQNANEVLTSVQQKRLKEAENSVTPVLIVDQQEVLEKENKRSNATKTWIFKANNVRDFAFASSRKFIWDAMGIPFGDRTVMAMSFYPKEGNPLWEKYSTKAVAHTLKVYSKYTFDYPYPVAISVHSNQIGMEYPMICFNGGRPQKDGTYSEQTKYSMIGVVIHEVGHNFFPMIVNSDERQWTWMDEGLNTFLEFLAEQEWEPGYPSRSGQPYKIVNYMKGDKKFLSPIMTNSESIWQFGNNAYSKPSTALNILRETVMGRELFDFAFKEYANRWKFKHPTPEDFFRTMEDASGVDLDWFWRGWFYTTDHVDISLEKVSWFQPSTKNPSIEIPLQQKVKKQSKVSITDIRNAAFSDQTATALDTSLNDFYSTFDADKVSASDMNEYEQLRSKLSDEELEVMESGKNFYQIEFKNIGGLVMPIILKAEFNDGTSETIRIPAEIWLKNNYSISKVFAFDQEVSQFLLDPYLETADVDLNNNHWPPKMQPSRFELYQRNYRSNSQNPMQKAKADAKADAAEHKD